MKKIVFAFIVFLLPSWLSGPISRILGYHICGRVGFSILLCDSCDIAQDAEIQSGCLIKIPHLQMAKGAKIKKLTVVKGRFSVVMRENSVLNYLSKLSNSPSLQYRENKFEIGKTAVLGVSALIDMTGNVTIGDYTVLAGSGSEIWTHSYYHSKDVPKRFRIDGDVTVGNNVYIGSRCILTAGVTIADNISIGAGSVVSKNLTQPGLYVNQPLRFLEFDPDAKLAACCERIPEAPIDLVYRKRTHA